MKISFVLALTLCTSGLAAVEPLIMRWIIDSVEAASGTPRLLSGVALLAGVLVLKEALAALINVWSWRTRLGVHYDLLEATVEQLHRLPLAYHHAQTVGATMTRLDRGIQGFLNATSELVFQALPAAVYLVIAAVLMLQLDFRLALLVLAFAPLPALIAARAGGEQAERERALLEVWSKIYSRFNEVLAGMLTVRSFNMEGAEKQRFLSGVAAANGRVIGGVALDSRRGALQGLCTAGARLSAIALGCWLVATGQGSLGTLVAFLAYLNGLFGPVQGLTSAYGSAQRARVALGHVFSILDAENTVQDAADARRLERARGEIKLERVSFAYAADRPAALTEVDLEVRAGERVALVGPSGSGKSTLVALLQRFYDPGSGKISIDGRDLRELEQCSLREQIGAVLQDNVLFDDSVRANIAYGRPHASDHEIVSAACAANAHQFIQRLPRGYDTPVGERGKFLSGGERQRVAIARALLKDPPILILDEATSALDSESEQLVQEALERLCRGRTTIIIAHRLSTVVNADRVVVLKDGRIHETGRHADLLRADGYYAFLVNQQLKGLTAAQAA